VRPVRIGLFAEPVADLESPDINVLYAECLARLQTSDGAVLRGGAFVSALEQAGEVSRLDHQILSLVFEALAANPGAHLSCNISPYTLADPVAWDRIVHAIATHTDLASRLTLEITESAPLDEISAVGDRLRQVQTSGCRIALDDFGSGYARFHRLCHVDVHWDVVKIDRKYLTDLSNTSSGRDSLVSMISLAECLAPLVVIEGIENQQNLAVARSAGAQFGQGWLFENGALGGWRDIDPSLRDRITASRAMRAAAVVCSGPASAIGKRMALARSHQCSLSARRLLA